MIEKIKTRFNKLLNDHPKKTVIAAATGAFLLGAWIF